jgi:hypothetical protein
MKYLNILYKSNSTSISIGIKDEVEASETLTSIINCRVEKKDTFIITANNLKVFINPLEIVHCELSDSPIN